LDDSHYMNIGMKTLAIVAIAAIVAVGVVYAAATLLATPGVLSSMYVESAAAVTKSKELASLSFTVPMSSAFA
jgi:hypothetical protein